MTAPAPAGPPPPRWKIALATWLAIYPTITALLLVVGPKLETWPVAVRTLFLTAVLVPLMTFALMPAITRALRPWLYPERSSLRCLHNL